MCVHAVCICECVCVCVWVRGKKKKKAFHAYSFNSELNYFTRMGPHNDVKVSQKYIFTKANV